MKNTLRKSSLEKRKNIDFDKVSKNILANLFSMKEYKAAKNVLCYYPLKNEVSTLICLEDSSKNWYLPRVYNMDLQICPYDKNNMRVGSFKIWEPQNNQIDDFSNFDMVIVPAVAADFNGYRLGYGKGYYDRFLPKLPKTCLKVIILPSELLYESVFPEDYDVPVDIVVTDNKIFKIYC